MPPDTPPAETPAVTTEPLTEQDLIDAQPITEVQTEVGPDDETDNGARPEDGDQPEDGSEVFVTPLLADDEEEFPA